MPKITFENDGIEVEVAAGTSFSLAADQAGASLGFGCRAGTCGTCALSVDAGAEGLEAAGYVEQDTLVEVGEDGPRRRLGCQIMVGETDLRVSW